MVVGACTTTTFMTPMAIILTILITITTIGLLMEVEITVGTIRTLVNTTRMAKMYGTTKWLTTHTGVNNLELTGIIIAIHTITITTLKITIQKMDMTHMHLILIILPTHMATKDLISEHTMVGMFMITMAIGARSKTITMIPMATSLTTHSNGFTTGMQMVT